MGNAPEEKQYQQRAASDAGTIAGRQPSKEASGSGGGYGINARPVGAYVVEGGRVRWEPALDVTGIAVRAMVTALGLAFLLRRLFD